MWEDSVENVFWHLLDLLCSCSRPDRLRDIADRFNVDHDAVLDNVLYARAYTSASNFIFLFYLFNNFGWGFKGFLLLL